MKFNGEIAIRENLLGQFDIYVSYDPPTDERAKPLTTVATIMEAEGLAEQIKYRIERGLSHRSIEFTWRT